MTDVQEARMRHQSCKAKLWPHRGRETSKLIVNAEIEAKDEDTQGKKSNESNGHLPAFFQREPIQGLFCDGGELGSIEYDLSHLAL